jgi:hypothetical protein
MPGTKPSPESARHKSVVDRILYELQRQPFVVAVGAYGSTATRDWSPHSDVDLLAVTNEPPPVESLRFFVGDVAVDLNFRSGDDGERGIGGADFVPDCMPLWDPDGFLRRARPTGRVHNPDATDVVRYMLFHDTQKLRQIASPTLRRVAMGGVVDQVLRAWYQARAEPFPGMVAAVGDLHARDPLLVELIDRAMAGGGIDSLVEAAERAAGPAGGIFSPGEVLAVSWKRPAVEPVPALLAPLVHAVADGG